MNRQKFYPNQPTWFLLAILLVGLLVAGCTTPLPGTPATDPSPEPVIQAEVVVENVETLILESFPVQVQAVVRGTLPDACSFISSVGQTRDDNTFEITLTTERQPEMRCAPSPTPFEETVPLDVVGLPAGDYTVNVHGATATFALATDNVPAAGEGPSTGGPLPGAGAISGRVWHDICAIAGGEGGEPAVPGEGCVIGEQGGFQANGILEEGEPGIGGIEVMLGQGGCPSSGVALATTADDGSYSFTGLGAGTYCVSVEATREPNASRLLPGGWTYPGFDEGSITVALEEAEQREDVNFGWDYQFLPETARCTNSAAFVEDVTFPDGTEVVAGVPFIKTWRLRNTGTCDWGPGYSLVHVGGDLLGATSPMPLQVVVAPGETTEFSMQMVAPARDGEVRSEWLLEAPDGTRFGVGEGGDAPIYAQVVVGEQGDDTSGASIEGWLWSDDCRLLDAEGGDATPSAGCVEDAAGGYRADGIPNNGETGIGGVRVELYEGACPASGEVIASTTTGDDGAYHFTDLDAGSYCVAINALAEANVPFLLPGDWTAPQVGVGSMTVELEPSVALTGIDFGWDYQLQ